MDRWEGREVRAEERTVEEVLEVEEAAREREEGWTGTERWRLREEAEERDGREEAEAESSAKNGEERIEGEGDAGGGAHCEAEGVSMAVTAEEGKGRDEPCRDTPSPQPPQTPSPP